MQKTSAQSESWHNCQSPAPPWGSLPLAASYQGWAELFPDLSSDAVEGMSCPYWKPPSDTLLSHTATPLLPCFPPSDSDDTLWPGAGHQGWHTPGPGLHLHSSATGAELLTKDASLLLAQGAAGQSCWAAASVTPTEPSPAGQQQDSPPR